MRESYFLVEVCSAYVELCISVPNVWLDFCLAQIQCLCSSALLKFISDETFITLKVYERQRHKNTLMVSLHLAATLSLLFTRLVLIYNSQGQANAAVAPLHPDMNMLWALTRPQCGPAVCIYT